MATTPRSVSKKAAVPATAKLFQNGRSQAVRLPKEFRFEGTEVRIRRTKRGVLLEPIPAGGSDELDRWFADLDRYNAIAGEFMPGGRKQLSMPKRNISFD